MNARPTLGVMGGTPGWAVPEDNPACYSIQSVDEIDRWLSCITESP